MTDDNLSSVLHQLARARGGSRKPGDGGSGHDHLQPIVCRARDEGGAQNRRVQARRWRPPIASPPSPTPVLPLRRRIFRSAVMIKTSWRRGWRIREYRTTIRAPAAMSQVIKDGTWPGPGRPDLQPPLRVTVDRSQIYTNITSQGSEWALTGIHFVTKDVREWVWVSLWWDQDASKDFGADRPASVNSRLKVAYGRTIRCSRSSSRRVMRRPGSYSGSQNTFRCLNQGGLRCDSGATHHRFGFAPAGLRVFFRIHSVRIAGNFGPWPCAPQAQTSWCSNPNIETHAANARTSCIGCHQIAFTRNERRNNDNASFIDVLLASCLSRSFSRTQELRGRVFLSFEIDFGRRSHWERHSLSSIGLRTSPSSGRLPAQDLQ